MELILASQSPRRHDIMRYMGLSFQSEVCTEPERIPEGASVSETVMHLARQKASYALRLHPDACVIGADTVVELDGEVLGKPGSPEDAVHTLARLQGRQHVVYTGLAVLKAGYEDVRYVSTKVRFRPMSEKEIRWYVSTGEPLDKAGSYGVQGFGSVFVDSVEGNYFNVVGLPAPTLYEMLLKANAVTEDRK
jgi:septum formation protein